MKKQILTILLILVLVTVYTVACDAGIEEPTIEPTTTIDYESEYVGEPEETEQDEPEEQPTDDITDNDNGNVDDNAEPAVTPEETTTPEETAPNNANEGVKIIVNGAVLSGVNAYPSTVGASPTHVPAAQVAWALGAEVTGAGLETAIEGLNGTIFFMVGSNEFDVNGETISLQHNTIQHNNVIYVPISFFSEAFGGSVTVNGNRIYING